MASDIDILRRENEKLRLENDLLVKRIQQLESDDSGQRQTIQGLSIMVLQVDDEFRIRYINSTMEKFVGCNRAELNGCAVSQIDDTSLGRGFIQLMLEKSRETGEELISEQEIHVDGKLRYVKVTTTFTNNVGQILVEDQSDFKRMEASFKRYVAPKVIDQLVKSGFDVFKPKKYEMTVLFADLRNFTSMSTRHPPELVKKIIDRFLGIMMKTIINADATVDKVVGDEVMALFGAPIRYHDHALRAVKTALEMQEAHRLVMQEWEEAGLEPLKMGIGINSGEMIVGNIGSELRMDYTVLGHHVNLGARLCSAARGGQILISMRSFELAREFLQNDPYCLEPPGEIQKRTENSGERHRRTHQNGKRHRHRVPRELTPDAGCRCVLHGMEFLGFFGIKVVAI